MKHKKLQPLENETQKDAENTEEMPDQINSFLSSLPPECRTNGFLQITKGLTTVLGGHLEPSVSPPIPANDPNIMDRIMLAACKHGPASYYLRPLDTAGRRISNPPQIGSFNVVAEDIEKFKNEHPDKITGAVLASMPSGPPDPAEESAVRAIQQEIVNTTKRVSALTQLDFVRSALKKLQPSPEDSGSKRQLEEALAKIESQLQAAQEKEERTRTQSDSTVVELLKAQPKLTDLVTAFVPVLAAYVARPAANNGNSEIFKAIIESSRAQNEVTVKSLQSVVEAVKASSETQMNALRESTTQFQQSMLAMMDDKHESRDMTSKNVVDLILQGMTFAKGMQRGEEPTAIVVIREIKDIIAGFLPPFLEAQKEKLAAAAARGPEALATETQRIEAFTQAEVRRQLAERHPQQPSLPPPMPASMPITASASTATPIPIQFVSPVETVLAKLAAEAQTTPLPAEPLWVMEALDLFPDRLLRTICEATTFEQAVTALHNYAPAAAVDNAIAAATATPEKAAWFTKGIGQLVSELAEPEEEDEKE